MKIFKLGNSLSIFTLGILVSEAASSQTGGTVTYGPSSTPVPALSGSLLIVLAVVMAVVAVRLLKSRPDGRLNSWVVALGAAVLVSTLGGVKLISDSYAGPSIEELTNASGGQVTVGEGTTRIVNTSLVPLQILSLSPTPDCAFNDNVNGGGGGESANGGGGTFKGTCSDSPSTALESADYCDVFVSCIM